MATRKSPKYEQADRAAHAPAPDSVAVHDVYLGLGANLGARARNLAAALSLLARSRGLTLRRVSSVYLTSPVGLTDQPDFLNLVAFFHARLSPAELLATALSVERRLGRVRTVRWGPRAVDVDILLIGDLRISDPELTVPHPRLRERQFVLTPLAEIAPDLELPGGGLVRDLAKGESEAVRKLGRLAELAAREAPIGKAGD